MFDYLRTPLTTGSHLAEFLPSTRTAPMIDVTGTIKKKTSSHGAAVVHVVIRNQHRSHNTASWCHAPK